MMCLKDVLLYILLLPIPAASPLFIGLYALAVILSIRPCGYCMAMFGVLFLTTSPHSPFIDAPLSTIPVDPLRPLTSPVAQRTWVTTNDGRWWDPGLVGYKELGKIHSELEKSSTNDTTSVMPAQPIPGASGSDSGADFNDSTGSGAVQTALGSGSWWRSVRGRLSGRLGSATSPTAAAPSPEGVAEPAPTSLSPSESVVPQDETLDTPSKLPPGYIDLRWNGLGFVLDLGFTRSEEGMKWELDEARRAVQRTQKWKSESSARDSAVSQQRTSLGYRAGHAVHYGVGERASSPSVAEEIPSAAKPREAFWRSGLSFLGEW